MCEAQSSLAKLLNTISIAEYEHHYQIVERALAGAIAQPEQPAPQGVFPAALRIALEDFDSMEPLGPTTEAVIAAAQQWYLATPPQAEQAEAAKPCLFESMGLAPLAKFPEVQK